MTNNEWEKDCSVYHCSDGDHPSWWVSISQTKQWQDWYKHASKNMLYDVDESQELGMMSEKHAQDFINFIEAQTRQDTVREVIEQLTLEKLYNPNCEFCGGSGYGYAEGGDDAWGGECHCDADYKPQYNEAVEDLNEKITQLRDDYGIKDE